MARLHPMLVHFPIALILVGVLIDLLRAHGGLKRASLSAVAQWCTTLGVIAALPAIGSGLLAHTFQAAPNEQVQGLINWHERLSYLVTLLFGILVAWRWDAHGEDALQMPWGYRLAAAIGAVLLVISSAIGGELVFEYGMGADRSTTVEGKSSTGAAQETTVPTVP